MTLPLVSIIMPVYNSSLYLKEAIDSILNQTYDNIELICVDDKSTDDSKIIIQSYTDTRVRTLFLTQNGGVANARNAALTKAKGELIAFQDSDDRSHPTRIARQVEYLMQHPEIDAVFTRVRLVDLYGNASGQWADDEKYITEEAIKAILPFRNCVSQPAAMLRRTSLTANPYNTAYKDSEDWGLWLSLLSEGKRLAKINEALVDYRIRPTSETSKSNADPIQKLIRFRTTFLRLQEEKGISGTVEENVKKALRNEKRQAPIKRWIIRPLRFAKRLLKANPFSLPFELMLLWLRLKTQKPAGVFFFLPYYHIGGAEKVHASIVGTMAAARPIVFFTQPSNDEGFYHAFDGIAQCFNVSKLMRFPMFDRWTQRIIVQHINKCKEATVMGCNTRVFYSMLSNFSEHINRVDLIHAFVHPEETGPEKWSLPVISKLDRRIFISQKTIEQMYSLYDANKVERSFYTRIALIRNYVTMSIEVEAEPIGKLPQLCYIGRGTPEKRVFLAASIAARVAQNIDGTTIQMIGDVKAAVPKNLQGFCRFEGVIRQENKIYKQLMNADILLLTSSREGLPMVMMEAMACGVIPIVTAVGDIPNIIEQGKNGYLLPVENEQAIIEEAAQIICDLSQDPQTTVRIKKQAYHDCERLFSQTQFEIEWRNTLRLRTK